MTKQFPISTGTPINMSPDARPRLPVRALAQLMSRRMVLANLTDQPVSLAQFNCLMAEHAPSEMKQACLMHYASEAVCDPLTAFLQHDGSLGLAGASERSPDFFYLFPDNFAEALPRLDDLVARTINSLALQLGAHGNPQAPALPLKRRIKPLPPEDAAWQWAEAMEALLAQPLAKAG
ncbi:hypothetical protein [uncultured Cohaesibacter sp.]|uniref:hypothetical protein n=1 Tax=uncultured Cohaesibacter sp. TaxID=1002546 RepID=UPI0029C79930|nr:hypothetical protein [uncultured Cohaesibacter sp.]